jgi:hypothetical protein
LYAQFGRGRFGFLKRAGIRERERYDQFFRKVGGIPGLENMLTYSNQEKQKIMSVI